MQQMYVTQQQLNMAGNALPNAPFQPQGGLPFGVPPSQSPMPVGGMMSQTLAQPPGVHLGPAPPNMSVPGMMQPPAPPFFVHGVPPMGPHPFLDRDRMVPPGRMGNALQPEYKLFELNRRLQQRPPESECDNLWWDGFCNDFFEDDATLAVSYVTEDGVPELYRVGRTLIGRFFRTLFEAGIADLYWHVRQPKEPLIRQVPGQRPLLVFDCEQTSLMAQYHTPVCKVVTDGRLVLELTFDDLMRIRSWSFAIRQHSELVPRQALVQDDMVYLEHAARNVTRCGLPAKLITFLKMCVILEPMQELMGRQKVYNNMSPRECLKTALYFKWTHTCAPHDAGKPAAAKKKKRRNPADTPPAATPLACPAQTPLGGMLPNSVKSGPDSVKNEPVEQKEPPTKKRAGGRARKNNSTAANAAAAAAASGQSAPAGQSPAPQTSAQSQSPGRSGVPNAEVMIVGEPQLLGGDVGLEDERVITRVENADYLRGPPNAPSFNGPAATLGQPGTSQLSAMLGAPPNGPPFGGPSGPGTPLMNTGPRANGPVPAAMQVGPTGPGTPLMGFGAMPHHPPNGLPPNSGPASMQQFGVAQQAANGQLPQVAMRGSPLAVPSPANSLSGQKAQNANGGRPNSVATPLGVAGPLSNQHPSRPCSVGSVASTHSNNVAPPAGFDFDHQNAAAASSSNLDGHAKRRGSFDA